MQFIRYGKGTIVQLTLFFLAASGTAFAASTPVPALPVPSANQMAWQKAGLLLFTHFGLQTFTGSNKTTGSFSDTNLFNPTQFNATEWVTAAKAGGFKGIILVCKHQDGYCTWQTQTTRYSVVSAPWMGGKGDVVKAVADAFHAAGLRFGVYLSVVDYHYMHYGTKEKVNYPTYGAYYLAQLREQFTNYGTIDEVWFDGNGADSMGMTTSDWENIYRTMVSLQPGSVCFQGWFNDSLHDMVRWPGNENGDAGDPDWGFQPAPGTTLVPVDTARWEPAEADVTLQGNWFYSNTAIVTLAQIQLIYQTSVGRGGVGLYNVAPNTKGLIDSASIVRLSQFKAWTDSIYGSNMSVGATAQASTVRGSDSTFGASKAIDTSFDTYWAPDSFATGRAETLTVTLAKVDTIRMFVLQEYIPLGQRVGAFNIQTYNGSAWSTAFSGGTTIGYKRIVKLSSPVAASRARLIITRSRPIPLISTFALIGNRILLTETAPRGAMNNESFPLKISMVRKGMILCSSPVGAGAVALEMMSINGKKAELHRSGASAGNPEFSIPPHAPGIFFLRAMVNGKEAAHRALFLP